MKTTAPLDLPTYPLASRSLIEASAGTGKTYTLAHLYLRYLMEQRIDVQSLLVVTFTNAATEELKGRIQRMLHELYAYLTTGDAVETIQQGLFENFIGDEQALLILQKAMVNFDRAAVYSIHGFCQRLLTMFPLEMGALLQVEISTEERDLRLAAVKDFWRRQFNGASVERYRWLLSGWPSPADLQQAISPLIDFHEQGYPVPVNSEDDAIAERINAEWRRLTGLWNQQGADVEDMLLNSEALNRRTVKKPTVTRLLADFTELVTGKPPLSLPEKWELLTRGKLSTAINKNKQEARLDLEFFSCADRFQQLHAGWVDYNKRAVLLAAAQSVIDATTEVKRINQVVSFNDIITRVSRALVSASAELKQRIGTLYPVAMVDEFQDTDQAQYRIFSTLYGAHDRLVMIGDPKQAIYSFRGADVFTYQHARRDVDELFTLDTNYRSTPDFVDVVNRLFQQHDNAFVLDEFIRYQASAAVDKPALTNSGAAVSPLVAWIHPFVDKALARGRAEIIFARRCALEVQRVLYGSDLKIGDEPVVASDLAVLVRTGRQASLIKQQLAALGISCAMTSRDSVFSTVQAREICQLLDALIDPTDTQRLLGLLSTDLFAYSANDIYALQENSVQLAELVGQMHGYRQRWSDRGFLPMFLGLLRDHGTVQLNKRQPDGERRLTNWLHIAELLQQQDASHASQGQALHWLVAQRDRAQQLDVNDAHQLRLESDSELVRVITIHKAKGLEYPIVFLPFVWHVTSARHQADCYSVHDAEGRKQMLVVDEAKRQRWHREQLAEEVRLLYVAITRARYRCYLGWAQVQGSDSSALAYCLYRPYLTDDHFPYRLKLPHADALLQPFVSLNQDAHLVEIDQAFEQAGQSLPKHDKPRAVTPAREFKRPVQQQWRISSYSHIASSGRIEDAHRPDHDSQAYLPESLGDSPDVQRFDRFGFLKGASAGNLLHEILELQPFDQPADSVLVQQKCSAYGVDERWLPCLTAWIDDVLYTSLGGFRLCDISAQQRLSEMEFYLRCNELGAAALTELLTTNGYLAVKRKYAFATIRGYLTGFIDLVIEHGGRYFIADYKSNYLGDTIAHYSAEHCAQSMLDNDYHLQYLIYTLALHRYLQGRIIDYDYATHFGGVYYLFLRGMSAADDKGHGVYFHRPEIALIEQLDRMIVE